MSFDGMDASGFYEPGAVVHLGTRGVTNLTDRPLTVVSLTVEAEGDESYLDGVFLVPLDPAVDGRAPRTTGGRSSRRSRT